MNRKWLSLTRRGTAAAALVAALLALAPSALAQEASAEKKEAEKQRLAARYLQLAGEIAKNGVL